MALDGKDLRCLPLSMRKTNLARRLARRSDGIFVAPFEAGEIGPELFEAACRMGSKAWCRSGVTARTAPVGRRIGAIERLTDAFSCEPQLSTSSPRHLTAARPAIFLPGIFSSINTARRWGYR